MKDIIYIIFVIWLNFTSNSFGKKWEKFFQAGDQSVFVLGNLGCVFVLTHFYTVLFNVNRKKLFSIFPFRESWDFISSQRDVFSDFF